MSIKVINFQNKLDLVNAHWAPKIIAELNDYQFKLAKFKGEFVWHDHPETDEAFILLHGNLEILLRGSTVQLSKGEMVVIPKGVEHKPVADGECHVLLVEPAGTVNTGNLGGERTSKNDEWV